MTNNLLKAWFHIRSLLCLEMNSVQELRAKVGCPASSLGLLTLSTREPISGEKTLAFSWVSFSHNLILCPITTEQYFFIFSLHYYWLCYWLLQTPTDGGWLQRCSRDEDEAAEAPWLRCDGDQTSGSPPSNPAAIQQVDVIYWSSIALNLFKRICVLSIVNI